jgi:hypothetical protein
MGFNFCIKMLGSTSQLVCAWSRQRFPQLNRKGMKMDY